MGDSESHLPEPVLDTKVPFLGVGLFRFGLTPLTSCVEVVPLLRKRDRNLNSGTPLVVELMYCTLPEKGPPLI